MWPHRVGRTDPNETRGNRRLRQVELLVAVTSDLDTDKAGVCNARTVAMRSLIASSIVCVACTTSSTLPVTADPGEQTGDAGGGKAVGNAAPTVPDVRCDGSPDAGPAGSFRHLTSEITAAVADPRHRGFDLVVARERRHAIDRRLDLVRDRRQGARGRRRRRVRVSRRRVGKARHRAHR